MGNGAVAGWICETASQHGRTQMNEELKKEMERIKAMYPQEENTFLHALLDALQIEIERLDDAYAEALRRDDW